MIPTSEIWQLTGELTFPTVSTLLTQFMQHPKPQLVDLSAVIRVDSAGLAFLIEIRRQQPHIVFKHLPHSLLKLAEVNGVLTLLNHP